MIIKIGPIPINLSLFGGGAGGGGFKRGRHSGRGGFHNARQQGRKQHGDTPMDNQTQNRQTDEIARQLGLTPKQARDLHHEVSDKGWGYRRVLQEAKEMFGLD